MLRARFAIAGILCVVLSGICERSFGVIVGKSAFNSTAVVEGFEAVPTSITFSSGPDYEPTTPYTFPSGLILSGPVPNRNDSFGVFVVHDGFFGLYAGQDVPDGIGYLGQANPGLLTGPIQLTFPTPVHLVGAYISGIGTLSVLDANRNVLETETISAPDPTQWASDFVAIERPELISSVVFTGDSNTTLRIDDVTFEVPEPCSAALFCPAAMLLWRRRAMRGAAMPAGRS